MNTFLKRSVPIAAAVVACVTFGFLTARPTPSPHEIQRLAGQFAFQATPINSPPADAKYERSVQPALNHIRSWISAVGAAVALTDLRGLGRSADACLVDPRDDSVTVLALPAAGGPIYPRFQLKPDGLPYDSTMAPMGCVPVDINEDGAMDFIVYYWGRSPVVFINMSPPASIPGPQNFKAFDLISPMQIWNTTAMNVGDIDGAGHVDLLVGNYFPDGARVLDPAATHDGRMWMQDGMGKARNAGTNRLLLVNPTGIPHTMPQLTDATTSMPADSTQSWTLAFGLQDLVGNHLPDIYVANDFGPDQLLVNTSTPGHVHLTPVTGRRDLTTPRSEVLGYDSFKGMGVTFTYPNGSGLPLMAVSNITMAYGLQESNLVFAPAGSGEDLLHGKLPFQERSEQLGMSRAGWCWDIKAGDFANTGVDELIQATGFVKGHRNRWAELQELAMGNDDLLRYPQAWPNFEPGDDLSGHEHPAFWAPTSDGRFVNIAERVGLGNDYVSRGLAFGDVYGDDKLDIVIANQWENSILLRNVSSNERPAADLRLLQPGAAGGLRDAIGAELLLKGSGKPQKRQLFPANGHAGVSASEVHLALPGARTAPATITWRDGTQLHTATVQVTPGHHTVVLSPDGSAVLQ
ncbi:MAG TPA: VCBS repeat-containing protein [Mycobacterium sp.]|nr:VCBS repeat-containing protein [Mycobacterium sp.]HTX95023.1 VCBS repeat-containing protein [Mycobacterium sp.]